MKNKLTYEELQKENFALQKQINALKPKAKNESQSNSAKFKAIATQAVEGITIADMTGKYVFVNPAFCQMSGYTQEELLALSVFDMKAKNQSHNAFESSKTQLKGNCFRVMLVNKKGVNYLAEIIGKKITFDGQEFVLGTIRDISERAEAEQELLKAKKEAELNQAKFTEVVSNISSIIWKADIDEQGLFKNTFISAVADKLMQLPEGTINHSFDTYFEQIDSVDIQRIKIR